VASALLERSEKAKDRRKSEVCRKGVRKRGRVSLGGESFVSSNWVLNQSFPPAGASSNKTGGLGWEGGGGGGVVLENA